MGDPAGLIGRDAELEELRKVVARARDGAGRIALIEGEPGIGKTWLCAAVAAHAGEVGFAVARGAAHALEAERPFALFADAFGLTPTAGDQDAAAIGELIHGTTPGFADSRYVAVDRITDLIEERVLARPLLLALEDLHWADTSSLLVLHRLAEMSQQLPLVLIGTLRPLPRSPDLHQTLERFHRHRAVTIEPAPLSADDVARIAAAHFGASPGPGLGTLLASAGGNPLFVTEVLSALEHEDLIVTERDIVDVGEASLPPSVTLTILRRLTYLSDATLDMLRVASVLGTSFSVTDLSRVLGRPAPELMPLIDEASRLGVLGEQRGSITFRHDLIRDAIYDDMLVSVRTALHHQVARALIDAGAPPMRIAPHVALGAEPGDAEAVAWMRRTAEDQGTMPHRAAELLDRAVQIAGEAVTEDLVLDRVEALLETGRTGDALAAAQEALKTYGSRRAQMLLLMAYGATWRFAEALEISDRLMGHPESTPEDVAELKAIVAVIQASIDRREAEALAKEALELALELKAERAEVTARVALYICLQRDGFIDEASEVVWVNLMGTTDIRAVDFFQVEPLPSHLGAVTPFSRAAERYRQQFKAWALAERSDNFGTALTVDLVRAAWGGARQLAAGWHSATVPIGPNSVGDDRFAETERALDRMYAAGNRSPNAMATYHWQLASLNQWRGDWDQAIAIAEAGLEFAEEAANIHCAAMIHEVLAYLAIHRGEPEEARAHLDAIPSAAWTRALYAESIGDDDLLAATLERFRRSVNSPKPWVMPTMWAVGPDWVRLYLDAGDRESARILIEVVELGAERSKVPTAEANALRCRGMLEDDVELMLRSVERHREAPRPVMRAQAFEDAAVMLARHGRKEEATALLRDAIQLYEDVDATWSLTRASARLRGVGVRSSKGRVAPRPKFGWESLTGSEQRVIALVPEGLTYREIGERLFISKRTVETHIAHVFAKLGISSRRELADQVRARALR